MNPFVQQLIPAKRIVFSGYFVAATIGLSACGNDKNIDFYRSSKSVSTDNIQMVVEANVHTHIGTNAAPDETHTTVEAELFGYDRTGYYYAIELAEGDHLTANLGGGDLDLLPDYYPSAAKPVGVIYYNDFDNTGAGTVFNVTLDRDRDAALHTVSVTLPPLAPYASTPSTTQPLELNETVTLSWTEEDDFSYALIFEVICVDADKNDYRYRIRQPSAEIEAITSPYSFTPQSIFNPTNPSVYSQCDLHTILKTYSDQTPESPASFADLVVRSSREQRFKYNLVLPE